jgi:hypothetical protein
VLKDGNYFVISIGDVAACRVYVCVCVCVCVFVCVCIYVCVYIYIYIYINVVPCREVGRLKKMEFLS